MIIRDARPRDEAAISRILAYTTIEHRGERFVVAEDGGRVVGVIGLRDEGELVIESLAVHPSHRGRGIGSRLVQTAIEDHSDVVLCTPIPDFFKKHGFEEIECPAGCRCEGQVYMRRASTTTR